MFPKGEQQHILCLVVPVLAVVRLEHKPNFDDTFFADHQPIYILIRIDLAMHNNYSCAFRIFFSLGDNKLFSDSYLQATIGE